MYVPVLKGKRNNPRTYSMLGIVLIIFFLLYFLLKYS